MTTSTRPERTLQYELEQLLQHIEHEPSNIGKRILVEQLLDDLRSSDPTRRNRARDLAKKDLGVTANTP